MDNIFSANDLNKSSDIFLYLDKQDCYLVYILRSFMATSPLVLYISGEWIYFGSL